MSVVQITNGFYRNQEVTGIFPVIQEMKEAKDGSTFITVDGSATEFDKAKMRVKVKPENVKVLSEHTETDEQVMDRIAERFSILDEMTQNPLLASKQRGTPREFPAQRRAEFQRFPCCAARTFRRLRQTSSDQSWSGRTPGSRPWRP